jgi:hypothetical protein
VGRFSTAEGFWQLYSHIIRADKITGSVDIMLFRDGIRPVWEDEANKNGGKVVDQDKEGNIDNSVGRAHSRHDRRAVNRAGYLRGSAKRPLPRRQHCPLDKELQTLMLSVSAAKGSLQEHSSTTFVVHHRVFEIFTQGGRRRRSRRGRTSF